MLGEEHGNALVAADPPCIPITAVGQVRRKQRIKVIVGNRALQRFEADLLQDDVAIRIGKNFLVNAVASVDRGVDQFVRRNTRFKGTILERAMPLLFGEKIAPAGDNESHVAGASLIDAWKIDFIENPMAERKPDLAVLVQRRTDTGFRAGGPTRRDSRPAGSVADGRIIHKISILTVPNETQR